MIAVVANTRLIRLLCLEIAHFEALLTLRTGSISDRDSSAVGSSGRNHISLRSRSSRLLVVICRLSVQSGLIVDPDIIR